MATVAVTTPDGAVHRVEIGTRALDVLKTAGVLNNQVVAAQANDRVVDLGRPLTEDCRLAPVAADSPLGLEVIRHSTAHLMAQAVKRLFPQVQVTIGPVIENGFYYDFKKAEPFAPEDLERIEATMREITKADLRVTREELPRDEAIALFREMG